MSLTSQSQKPATNSFVSAVDSRRYRSTSQSNRRTMRSEGILH
jgi:hypothetical protein